MSTYYCQCIQCLRTLADEISDVVAERQSARDSNAKYLDGSARPMSGNDGGWEAVCFRFPSVITISTVLKRFSDRLLVVRSKFFWVRRTHCSYSLGPSHWRLLRSRRLWGSSTKTLIFAVMQSCAEYTVTLVIAYSGMYAECMMEREDQLGDQNTGDLFRWSPF